MFSLSFELEKENSTTDVPHNTKNNQLLTFPFFLRAILLLIRAISAPRGAFWKLSNNYSLRHLFYSPVFKHG